MDSKSARTPLRPQSPRVQAIDSARVPANRYRLKLTQEQRKEIADEARVRGCVQTAKARGITVGLVLELRIEALDAVIRAQREWIASLERRAA